VGPLAGLKVIELSGIGPAPMCGMLLADLGATVLRIDRPRPSGLGLPIPPRYDLLLRNRPALALDLKQSAAVALVLDLIEQADALIEGFRPAVMERLGLGPDICLQRNNRLVYGRVTGWGQEGPLAHAAGHDLNYIALVGVLSAIGRRGQKPTPPLNLVGDFGGGALYLAFGIMCALHEASRSGQGQVVDAAMIDGAASLMTSAYGAFAAGSVSDERGTNTLDSGAYFYEVYECADGSFISIAAIEEKFHTELLRRLDLDPAELPAQWQRENWPRVKSIIAERFRQRTRAEWCQRLEGSDVCFAPVLTLSEAPLHPHLAARGTFVVVDGVVQPAPAPRFSHSVPPTPVPRAPPVAPEIALAAWMDEAAIAAARARGAFD
jgi:alpha-methylacyl-CoA racemase